MKNLRFLLAAGTALAAALAFSFFDNAVEASDSAIIPAAVKSADKDNAAWMTDFAAAQKQAKAEGKSLLLDFTGSDWCGWCMKLDREVFSTSEFRDYAKNHLVLVKVDFPAHKQQSAAEKAQNDQLQNKYRIEGYPTLVILKPDGQQLGTMGYMPGGPKSFIEKLGGIVAG